MASRVLGVCLESVPNRNTRDRVFEVNDLYVATYPVQPWVLFSLVTPSTTKPHVNLTSNDDYSPIN